MGLRAVVPKVLVVAMPLELLLKWTAILARVAGFRNDYLATLFETAC
jgi:hypothetical protein